MSTPASVVGPSHHLAAAQELSRFRQARQRTFGSCNHSVSGGVRQSPAAKSHSKLEQGRLIARVRGFPRIKFTMAAACPLADVWGLAALRLTTGHCVGEYPKLASFQKINVSDHAAARSSLSAPCVTILKRVVGWRPLRLCRQGKKPETGYRELVGRYANGLVNRL